MWLDAYDRWVFHFLGNGAVPVTSGEALPALAVPLSGEVSRPYGWVTEDGRQYFHNGIDIQTAGGSTVRAALAGKVIRAGEDPVLGLVVEIDHGRGLVTVYGTLGDTRVTPGQVVERGDVIAVLARGEKAQLHFEVRRDGQGVDPALMLTSQDKI
nr:M23 family metallopeptidase [Moorella sulfitireducens]